jgi:hypothetical protein
MKPVTTGGSEAEDKGARESPRPLHLLRRALMSGSVMPASWMRAYCSGAPLPPVFHKC